MSTTTGTRTVVSSIVRKRLPGLQERVERAEDHGSTARASRRRWLLLRR